MDQDNAELDTPYMVVMNDEEQYSIWPAARALPPGWVQSGPIGSRTHCLEYIKTVWTDMRPRSLRLQMEAAASTRS